VISCSLTVKLIISYSEFHVVTGICIFHIAITLRLSKTKFQMPCMFEFMNIENFYSAYDEGKAQKYRQRLHTTHKACLSIYMNDIVQI
jgi:hypothetical protein